jgi:D-sedoheptulose 7-phosphate isomerase
MPYTKQYLAEAAQILSQIDAAVIDRMVQELVELRARGGRLFIMGSGGGAGHASHAVNDFRKITGIEAYSPTDNVSELTARINDDGWESSYVNWLKVSRFSAPGWISPHRGDQSARCGPGLPAPGSGGSHKFRAPAPASPG